MKINLMPPPITTSHDVNRPKRKGNITLLHRASALCGRVFLFLLLSLSFTLTACDKCGCDIDPETNASKQAVGITVVCDTAWGEESIVEI